MARAEHLALVLTLAAPLAIAQAEPPPTTLLEFIADWSTEEQALLDAAWATRTSVQTNQPTTEPQAAPAAGDHHVEDHNAPATID